MDDSNQNKLRTHEADKEQMLAAYNDGREQMRFINNREWRLTYNAVLAYAALAGAPIIFEDLPEHQRIGISVCAFVLVLLVAVQAGRALWYTKAQRDSERSRLRKAIERLKWMGEIEEIQVPKRSERPWWVRLWRRDREQALPPLGTPERPGTAKASEETDSDFVVSPGLGLVVVVGAGFAIVIICSHLPLVLGYPLAGLVAIVIFSSWIPCVRQNIFRLPA